jgi:hypothetical protein
MNLRTLLICSLSATLAAMHTAFLRRAKRVGLLVATLLVLVQPAAWAEGNTRKVGIVTISSVEAASRSPVFKRFSDAVRASAPGLEISFELRSAEGESEPPGNLGGSNS